MSVYSIMMSTFECWGKGPEFTKKHLDSIIAQTYRPLQCVISDHSKNSEIEDIVRATEPGGVDLIYVRYEKDYGNGVSNWGNACDHATGDYLQYASMDDWYHDPTAVERLVKFMDENTSVNWAILPVNQYPQGTQYRPRWPSNFNFTINTIGGPSSNLIRRVLKNIRMDNQHIYFGDVEWFYRLYIAAGKPVIYPGDTIFTIRSHPLQQQNIISKDRQNNDIKLLLDKYNNLDRFTN